MVEDKNTRFRITVLITKIVFVLLILSLLIDIANGLFPLLIGGAAFIKFGEFTLLIAGVFIAKMGAAIESYFDTKRQEDKERDIKIAVDGKK